MLKNGDSVASDSLCDLIYIFNILNNMLNGDE